MKRCLGVCSRRGRRYPAAAHTGAVALRVDCPAVLTQGVRRATRYANCVRFAQTGATRMFTKRAARATPWAALLGAPEIASAGYRLPRSCVIGCPTNTRNSPAKARGHRAQRASGAPRSAGLAASAKRVRNILVAPCLSVVNAVNEASCATGRKPEHRRAVDAKRDRPSEAPRPVPARLCRDQHRMQDNETTVAHNSTAPSTVACASAGTQAHLHHRLPNSRRHPKPAPATPAPATPAYGWYYARSA